MQEAFQGLGLTGYDNIKGRYVSTWCDSLGTSLLLMTGTCSEGGKVLTLSGECVDPMRRTRRFRSVQRLVDADTFTCEMFDLGPGDAERRQFELTYTRQGTRGTKAAPAVPPHDPGGSGRKP